MREISGNGPNKPAALMLFQKGVGQFAKEVGWIEMLMKIHMVDGK